MADTKKAAVPGIIVAVVVGAAIAWAGSQGGTTLGGLPVFAIAVAMAYVIQWVVFIPSYIRHTERYYDITGSMTYILVMLFAVLASGATDPRSLLLLGLVLVWAMRLGSFLFARVRRAGGDVRFDRIKQSLPDFLMTWTVQGLWVSLTLAAALGAVTSAERTSLDGFAMAGLAIWVLGFGVESTADLQKKRFRADPAHRGEFISSGLWSVSRHPNYLGEITLWTGIAMIAFPTLAGWRLVTLVSPVFVCLLITRVSGIPILERRADGRWGGRGDYEDYKRRTPVLVPWIGRRG